MVPCQSNCTKPEFLSFRNPLKTGFRMSSVQLFDITWSAISPPVYLGFSFMKGSFDTESEKLFNPGNKIIIRIRQKKAQEIPAIIFTFFILFEDLKDEF
jgi:hypothetical protein